MTEVKDLNDKLKPSPRLCAVCSARVRNQNPKVDTCDSVCTRAKKAGRNRVAQHAVDIETEALG